MGYMYWASLTFPPQSHSLTWLDGSTVIRRMRDLLSKPSRRTDSETP